MLGTTVSGTYVTFWFFKYCEAHYDAILCHLTMTSHSKLNASYHCMIYACCIIYAYNIGQKFLRGFLKLDFWV
jgi:hypothetical protein